MLARKVGLRTPREAAAVYGYQDEEGTTLFEVVRFPGKKFRQRRPDGHGGWIWNLKEVRRVLYRLPALIARPDELVYVVEGEKDADRLASLGLLATTNAGGAGKWRREYSRFLASRDVIILGDNDDVGRKHVQEVAKSLAGQARSIRVVELADLPPKGDVSDWLDAGGTPEQLRVLVDASPGWRPSDEDASDDDAPSGTTDKESGATTLVRLALESGIELFYDEREEPHARVETKRGRRVVPVGSRLFERVLMQTAWRNLERAPGAEVLHTAARMLGSIACLERDQIRLSVRHARHEGEIWVDLNGARAVRVGPRGWTVVETPPILFRAFQHQRPLPDPVQGGDAELVFDFVNLPDDDARTLFVNHLVASLVPDIPVAGLAVHGVQGSAKSSLLRITKRLLDPSGVELRRSAKDATELAQALFHNRVLILDNLSGLPDWMSDALCGAITGDGWAKRALFTNEDDVCFEYQRVIGIAGINLVVERADLLDRCVLLELRHVTRQTRREEREFWSAFEQARPRILGGLLDRLSKAMAAADNLPLQNLQRMADYSRWGAASAQAGGQRPEAFLTAYDRNVNRQSEVAIDASPIGEAVVILVSRTGEWVGPPAQLHEDLTQIAQELHIDVRGKAWPKAPNVMTRRLKEIETPLLARGVSIVITRSGTGRAIRLVATPANTVTSVTTVHDAAQTAPLGLSRDGTSAEQSSHAPSRPFASPEGLRAVGVDGVGSDDVPGSPTGKAANDEAEERAERAAIIEFDAGRTRKEGEKAAARVIPLPLEAGGWW